MERHRCCQCCHIREKIKYRQKKLTPRDASDPDFGLKVDNMVDVI